MHFSRKKILYALVFTGIFAGETNIAVARWATPQDASSEIQYINHTIYIHKDGTSSNIYEIQAKLLKGESKATWANYIFPYNAQKNTLKILEASTLVNNKKYHINPIKIKDQPLSSKEKYFNQQNQVSMPFSHLEMGSIVCLKIKIKNFKPQLKNMFSTHFTFGNQFYTHSTNVHITSELPLYISTNDPDKLLSIKQSKKKRENKILYYLDVHQKKLIYKDIVDENNIHFNLKNIPLVSVTAMPDLTHYGKMAAIEYTKVKNQKLPPLYQDIANIAKTKATPIDRINTVTSLLAEKITYLADSRGLKGGFIPQSLQQVATTHLGDCKDFSMGTSVILKAIGIPSKIAIIRSGETELPFPSDLPGHGINHAIVKVELPEGPLWIDPTYYLTMGKNIFPAIANRKALVLHKNYATYENIPAIKATDYRFIKHETWDIKNPNETFITGTIQLLGGTAQMFTGQKNRFSDTAIKENFISSASGNHGQVLTYDVTLPDLSSRIVKDLSFDYSITAKTSKLKTNTGNAIPLSFKNSKIFITQKGTVSDTYLGPPRIFESYVTIQNIHPVGNQKLDCELDSPWVNLSRTVQYDKNKAAVLIHQKMEVKKSWIEGKELASQEYQQLQSGISENFMNGMALILNEHSDSDKID